MQIYKKTRSRSSSLLSLVIKVVMILTIFAGFSFNNDTNGIGFLIMAIFCLISTFLVYFRGYILK